MTIIRSINDSEAAEWDAYVAGHPASSAYHVFAFKRAVQETYGHDGIYLAAFDKETRRIIGVLPIFKIKSILFGKTLVSIPFCDYGGILYDDEKIGALLLTQAKSLMKETRCDCLELRQTYPLPFLSAIPPGQVDSIASKVRMKVRLPGSGAELFASFPDKLRSQIRKPQKEGCTVRNGGTELLDDFYKVFVYNMRDLGSPVHSKKMMLNVLRFFGESSRLFVVYLKKTPIACSLVIGFNKVLVNPWASFNKNFRSIAPNMLLYWSTLEYAAENGYEYFDFGRSTVDEGTFRFKKQWGALPEALTWYYVYPEAQHPASVAADGNKKQLFIKVWQKLPLGVTRIVGPILRKQIPL